MPPSPVARWRPGGRGCGICGGVQWRCRLEGAGRGTPEVGDARARGGPPRHDEGVRGLCVLMALVGVVILASPIGFHPEPLLVFLFRIGTGLAVIGLALYFYFEI